MSFEEKQKLFLLRINNLHSEYEALINDIVKDFRMEMLIPFCDCYGIDFVVKKYDFFFLKEGVEVFDHDELCYNKVFEDEWRKVNNILTSYVGIEGDYVLGNFVDCYTHNSSDE